MGSTDVNDIAYWLPPLQAAGLPVPRTELVHTEVPLFDILDGMLSGSLWEHFIDELQGAATRLGTLPYFLRTGHTSGKHSWVRTCYVAAAGQLRQNVANLIEESALCDLPVATWAVRELIATAPLFYCTGYGGFPVVREFRMFVEDGTVAHVQPYWPPLACELGHPDAADWRARLAAASTLADEERARLGRLAMVAGSTLGGYWSVDMLQAADGGWWVTDMADGMRSYAYDPATGGVLDAGELRRSS